MWLPIDLTAEIEALDFTGELELIAIEEGRVDLDRELAALEAGFWESAGAAHPDFAPDPSVVPESSSALAAPAAPAALAPPAAPASPAPLAPPAAPAVPGTGPAWPAPIAAAEVEDDDLATLPVPEEYLRPNRPAIAGRRRAVRLRRRILATVLAVVVAAVTIGGVARLLGRAEPRRDVVMSVDGDAVTVVTRSRTVGDLLHARGVALRPGDRVVPSLATPIEQGMPVRVIRSFPITLDVDGRARTIRTTRRSLRALRRELRLPVALVRVGESGAITDGSRVVLRTPHDTTLDVDGKVSTVKGATVLTVRGLLVSRKIVVDGDDIVEPGLDTRLADGMKVLVTRITTDQVVDEKILPFPTEYRDDPNLWASHTKVLQAGRNGLARVVSQVARDRDGNIKSWTELRTTVLRDPVTAIVARGTKPAGTQRPPAPPASSGGTAAAPSGGRFFQSGTATWYASHAGAGACAHLTLPFGTIVRIVNTANGRSAQCRVGDRGPQAWTGHIIDLNPDVFQQLAPLGTGTISVKLFIL